MAFTSRIRKIPSLFSKPDKSVQFAQENTILVIDDQNKMRESGVRQFQNEGTNNQTALPMSMEQPQATAGRPILKNGPNSKSEPPRRPNDIQRLNAINREMDMFVRQQEASRLFFNQFTDRLKQTEKEQREKLAASWRNPGIKNLVASSHISATATPSTNQSVLNKIRAANNSQPLVSSQASQNVPIEQFISSRDPQIEDDGSKGNEDLSSLLDNISASNLQKRVKRRITPIRKYRASKEGDQSENTASMRGHQSYNGKSGTCGADQSSQQNSIENLKDILDVQDQELSEVLVAPMPIMRFIKDQVSLVESTSLTHQIINNTSLASLASSEQGQAPIETDIYNQTNSSVQSGEEDTVLHRVATREKVEMQTSDTVNASEAAELVYSNRRNSHEQSQLNLKNRHERKFVAESIPKGSQQRDRNTVLLPKLQKPKMLAPRGRNVYIGSNLSMTNTKGSREESKKKKSAIARQRPSLKGSKNSERGMKDSFSLSGGFEASQSREQTNSPMDQNFLMQHQHLQSGQISVINSREGNDSEATQNPTSSSNLLVVQTDDLSNEDEIAYTSIKKTSKTKLFKPSTRLSGFTKVQKTPMKGHHATNQSEKKDVVGGSLKRRTEDKNGRVQQELSKIARGLPFINSPLIKNSPLLTKEHIQLLQKIKQQQNQTKRYQNLSNPYLQPQTTGLQSYDSTLLNRRGSDLGASREEVRRPKNLSISSKQSAYFIGSHTQKLQQLGPLRAQGGFLPLGSSSQKLKKLTSERNAGRSLKQDLTLIEESKESTLDEILKRSPQGCEPRHTHPDLPQIARNRFNKNQNEKSLTVESLGEPEYSHLLEQTPASQVSETMHFEKQSDRPVAQSRNVRQASNQLHCASTDDLGANKRAQIVIRADNKLCGRK